MEDKNTEETKKTADSIVVTDLSKEEKKEQPKITPEDEKIINTFKNINPSAEDLISLVNNLSHFNHELKSLKDVSFFITEENIGILKKLNEKDNIKINLLLSKLYINLISNESLYSNFLVEIEEQNLNLIMQVIDECIILIQKLSGFVFDPEMFKFKEKTLSLIKCIYWNCKKKITNITISQKLEGLIDSFPTQFYSETYNELNKEKDLYDILKSQDQEKINNFEDKFAQINNYFEQFEAFKKFVESNAGIVNYATIGEAGEEKKTDVALIDPEKMDFYQQYGMLLLKFCKYHHYIFLNAENKEEKKPETDSEIDNVRVVFLLDKIKYESEEAKAEEKKEDGNAKKDEENQSPENIMDKSQGNKKIINLMNQKSFTSIVESKEYNDLIKTEINKYLEMTKNHENDPKLKTVIEQMKYFLSILDVESYVPLYLSDFSKITISDNFTPSFLTNVPAGKKNEFYLETKTNETMLVFIEFSLEDKSKDISFEVNKYEIYSNEYKNIFKEEKIEDTFKFFILCSGYSLYQIIFDNYYSWFTSKDVNYRIALLKLNDKQIKGLETEEKKEENEEPKEEKKEEEKPKEEEKETEKDDENKLYCYFNGKNIAFDQKEICQKIKTAMENKDPNIINIPVVLYLNTLRIISFEDEKGISIKEYTDEDEDLFSKTAFELKIKNYLSKTLKLKPADIKDKKIIISIFSQNRELSSLNEEIAEKINAVKSNSINNSVKDPEYINYLEKIGFYPGEKIEGYENKIDYKLYDLCEQGLIYYLFNCKTQNKEIKKSVLLMLFDDKVVKNAAIFNEGAVFSNVKGKKNYLNNININDENGVLDFLENANDTFEGIELVLSCFDYKEKEGKKLEELIEKIKKCCEEKLKINVTVCEESQISHNVLKYMNLFYKN